MILEILKYGSAGLLILMFVIVGIMSIKASYDAMVGKKEDR